MKLRKALSTLLAAAMMVGLLCIPSMAASPIKVTNDMYPYNTVSLSNAVNEGTAQLGIYHSDKLATPVRVYTIQAGQTVSVTGQYYVQAHKVTKQADGSYELRPTNAALGLQGDAVLGTSDGWKLLPGYPTATGYTAVLNNSHVGTWVLNGYKIILNVVEMPVPQDTRLAIYEVTASSLAVRTGDSTYFAQVGTLTQGTRFLVDTRSNDGCWGRVVTQQTYCNCGESYYSHATKGWLHHVGWVHLDGARFLGYKTICEVITRQHPVWSAANTYRLNVNVAVHDGPADLHENLKNVILPAGKLVDITEFYGQDWGYLADGSGWIRLGYNGNYQNVQYAAIKTITTSNLDTPNSVKIKSEGEPVLARVTIKWNAGLIPVRTSIGYVDTNVPNDGATPTGIAQNFPVIGYLAHQHNGQKIDLINVQNDWGQLPSVNGQPGGWIYLPEIGELEAG